ncbi:MAG: hypothetical protein GC149_10385 [Gammaproteobacteria bacterium]|nr:hypothetical protein [Gammaproteobacteria bacterium]
MQADLEDFKTGWYGLTLGLKSEEIDKLIAALNHLKTSKDHFHFRSEFEGDGGVGDIEFYYQTQDLGSNLAIEGF